MEKTSSHKTINAVHKRCIPITITKIHLFLFIHLINICFTKNRPLCNNSKKKEKFSFSQLLIVSWHSSLRCTSTKRSFIHSSRQRVDLTPLEANWICPDDVLHKSRSLTIIRRKKRLLQGGQPSSGSAFYIQQIYLSKSLVYGFFLESITDKF